MIVIGGIAVVLLGLAGFGGWILSLPPATAASAPAVLQDETDAMLAALRYEGEGRPVIADVVMLATEDGRVQLYPAMRVEADATIAAFDAEHPDGADYVIVPAMSRDDDPAVLAWLQDQSRKGATIIGVCAGAKVVGAAGLLDEKHGTTHWYYLGEMLRRNPTIEYVADRRMVADGNVVTTNGITAAMPMMLGLIDAIVGPEKTEAVARDPGVGNWEMRHVSGAFQLTRPFRNTSTRKPHGLLESQHVGDRACGRNGQDPPSHDRRCLVADLSVAGCHFRTGLIRNRHGERRAHSAGSCRRGLAGRSI